MASLVVLLSLLVTADEPNNTDMRRLEGTWRVTGGLRTTRNYGREWVFHDGKLIIKSGRSAVEATYRIDATENPRHLDIEYRPAGADRKGVWRCIYFLYAEDILEICTKRSMSERPKHFATKAMKKPGEPKEDPQGRELLFLNKRIPQ